MIQNISRGSDRRTALFFAGLAGIGILTAAGRAYLLGDDYFMLAHWRWVLENGFPHADPLSMHEGFRFSVEKWLSCAALYHLYESAGIWGLRLSLGLVVAAIFALQYRLCALTSGNRQISMAAAAVITLLGLRFFLLRPQTVTILILTAELYCLEQYMKMGRVRGLLRLPLLAWLEMGVHSTLWPGFFLVLLPYLADFSAENGKLFFHIRRKLPLAGAGLLSFGALFLNPYGAWSVFYIFRSYGDADMTRLISELNPTTFHDYDWLLGTLLVTLALCIGNRKMPPRYYMILAGFFLFALTAQRNIMFFTQFGGFTAAVLLRDRRLRLRWNLLPALPVILAGALLSGCSASEKDVRQLRENEQIIDVLAEEAESGAVIYADFNTGSYAEYRGFRPYIDGRAEVFLKSVNGRADIFHEYAQLSSGELYYRDFLDRYDFDYLVVNENLEPALYHALEHDGDFRLLIRREPCAVFVLY